MTTFTGPLIVASATNQGDGTSVAKVSVNGQIETDAGLSVAGALSAASMGITGTGTLGGHTLAASALTLVLGTNAEASAGNAGAVPTSAAGFFEITVDSSAHLVPYFKVPT